MMTALHQHWPEPSAGWYSNHATICEFLATGDETHFMRPRGEEFWPILTASCVPSPNASDYEPIPKGIEQVKHPERSPCA